MSNPLVSVVVSTYNHQKYIADCLEGILMQQTTFPFEIILGEDESNDGTREICMIYAEKHPNKIKLFLRSRKDVIYIGGNPTGRYNFLENLKASTGKYIALCEGDDYWTDPLKLQKQVDFMEANFEYGICFHEAAISWSEQKEAHKIQLNSQFFWNRMSVSKDIYDISDVLNGPFMATASVLYRNPYIENYPNWFSKAASGDITLYAIIIGDKKIKFINEVMCVYRRHSGGITRFNKGNDIILNRLQILKHINEYYDSKYIHNIRSSVSDYLGAVKSLNFQEYMLLLRVYITSTIVEKKYIVSFFKIGLKKIL